MYITGTHTDDDGLWNDNELSPAELRSLRRQGATIQRQPHAPVQLHHHLEAHTIPEVRKMIRKQREEDRIRQRMRESQMDD